MHHRQDACAIGMRMGIRVVGAPMRGPARVAYAERTGMRTRAIFDAFHKVGNFTGAAAHFKVSSRGENSDARRVIAAIFELAESFEQYGSYIGALWPDVANDTAHEVGYPFYCQVDVNECSLLSFYLHH